MTVPRDQETASDSDSGAADGEVSAAQAADADGDGAGLEMEPMEVDLMLLVGIGTALFFVAFLILYPMHASLERSGHGRWPWIALSGALLGLIGLVYCFRRAQRMSKVNAE